MCRLTLGHRNFSFKFLNHLYTLFVLELHRVWSLFLEWLAYHYQTANLRHLIIHADPRSKTSPSKVLDRWRDRINIQEWNGTDFLPPTFHDEVPQGTEKEEMFDSYILRQEHFHLECLKEFKRQNLGWTIMIDTDEYLIPREELPSNQNKKTIPTVSDILTTLQIPPSFERIYNPCITIFRRQFSAKESPENMVQSMVSPGFDGKDFLTLRFRRYGPKNTWHPTNFGHACEIASFLSGPPNKVIVNLSWMTMEELSDHKNTGNPHQPLKICPNAFEHPSDSPFVLHHYAGTPEQWYSRSNDSRGE